MKLALQKVALVTTFENHISGRRVLPDFCRGEEAQKALGYISAFFTEHPLSIGCRIEVAMIMIEGGLNALPQNARDEVVAHLVERVFAMRACRGHPEMPPAGVFAGRMVGDATASASHRAA